MHTSIRECVIFSHCNCLASIWHWAIVQTSLSDISKTTQNNIWYKIWYDHNLNVGIAENACEIVVCDVDAIFEKGEVSFSYTKYSCHIHE